MTVADRSRAAGWVENRPTTGWLRLPDVGELIAHRRIAWYLALRDIQLRYKQTLIGAGWTVVKPLLGVGLFTVIFGHLVGVPSNRTPYAVFVLSGLLGWTYFSGALAAAATSLLENAEMVTKIYFPRLLAPLSRVLPGLLDFAVGLVVLAVLMAIDGVAPTVALVSLPVWLAWLATLAFGAGCLLAAVTVRYRDVAHGLPYVLQLGLFATPVIYPSSLPSGALSWILHLNPVVAPIDGLRWSLIGGAAPGGRDLLSIGIGAVLATAGVLYFCRAERRFADVI